MCASRNARAISVLRWSPASMSPSNQTETSSRNNAARWVRSLSIAPASRWEYETKMRTGILPAGDAVFAVRVLGALVFLTFGCLDAAVGFGIPGGMMNHTAPPVLANSYGRVHAVKDRPVLTYHPP